MQRSESREPTNILYVAIKVQDSESDAEVSKKLDSFCEGRLAQLKEGNLRRLTFIILKSKSFPKYHNLIQQLKYSVKSIFKVYLFSGFGTDII